MRRWGGWFGQARSASFQLAPGSPRHAGTTDPRLASPLFCMRVIRAAHPDDWLAAARIHVRGWQATYRGFMSDVFLDGVGARRVVRLARTPVPQPAAISEKSDRNRGWSRRGLCRPRTVAQRGPVCLGELYAIYLEPDRIGQGLGRPLIASARRALVQLGHQRADLWVLASNHRTRAFYEARRLDCGWFREDGRSRRWRGGRSAIRAGSRIAGHDLKR